MKKYRSGSLPEFHSLSAIKKITNPTESVKNLIQRQRLMRNVKIYKLEKENKELRKNFKELNERLNSLIGLRKQKTLIKEEKKSVVSSDQIKCYEKELDYYKKEYKKYKSKCEVAKDFMRLRTLEKDIENKEKIAEELEESIKKYKILLKGKEKALNMISLVGDNFENFKSIEDCHEQINLFHKRIQKSTESSTQTRESLRKVQNKCEKLEKTFETLQKELEHLGIIPNLAYSARKSEEYEKKAKKLRTLCSENNSKLKIFHSKIKKLTEILAKVKSEEQYLQSNYENLTKSVSFNFSIVNNLQEKGFSSKNV